MRFSTTAFCCTQRRHLSIHPHSKRRHIMMISLVYLFFGFHDIVSLPEVVLKQVCLHFIMSSNDVDVR
jgi:hypothetical protein